MQASFSRCLVLGISLLPFLFFAFVVSFLEIRVESRKRKRGELVEIVKMKLSSCQNLPLCQDDGGSPPAPLFLSLHSGRSNEKEGTSARNGI